MAANLQVLTRVREIQDLSIKELWGKLIRTKTDTTCLKQDWELHSVLHVLVDKYKEKTETKIYIPRHLYELIKLLEEVHQVSIHIYACVLIRSFCDNSSVPKYSNIRTIVIQSLVTLLQETFVSEPREKLLELYKQITCILLFFSMRPENICEDSVLCRNVIRNMMRLCDVSNVDTFGYAKEAGEIVREEIDGKKMVGRVTPLNEKECEKAFARYLARPDYTNITNLRSGFQVRLCHNETMHETMLNKGYYTATTVAGKDEKMTFMVTSVLDGGHFWGWLVNNQLSLDMMKEMGELSYDNALTNVKMGHIYIIQNPEIGVCRCQVMEHSARGIRVFCIDYGNREWVRKRDGKWLIQVFPCPERFQNLQQYPAQARLFQIQGSYYPPRSQTVIYNALGVLLNLTRKAHTEDFQQTNIVRNMLDLCLTSTEAITGKVLQVLSNLALLVGLKNQTMVACNVMKKVLEIVTLLMDNHTILSIGLGVAANLMHQCMENKALFQEQEIGTKLLQELSSKRDLPKDVQDVIKTTTMTYFSSYHKKPNRVETTSTRESEKKKNRISEATKIRTPTLQQQIEQKKNISRKHNLGGEAKFSETNRIGSN